MATLDFTQRPEFGAYVYNEEHTVDVLITIKAGRSHEDNNRASITLSAAIDTSGSMSGAKLELVKKTLAFATKQLGVTDKLGLVSYDSETREVSSMTEMSAEAKQRAEEAVKQMNSNGATNLSGGLFKSIEQAKQTFERDDDGNPGPVYAVLLLTDGLANRGVIDAETLEASLVASQRDGPAIKVHTFGYGHDHNANLLTRLAEVTDGSYYFIEKDEDVPTSFGNALGGLLSVVIQNISINVNTVQNEINIEQVFTGLKKTQEHDGSHKIETTDLYAEERKDIVIRLRIPAIASPVDAYPMLNVQMSYFDVQSGATTTNEAIVSVSRPGEVPPVQVADEDFLEQKARITVAENLESAAALATAGDFNSAFSALRDSCGLLDMMQPSPYTRGITRDINRVQRLSSSSNPGQLTASLLQMTSAHRSQRGTSEAFRTETQETFQCRARAATETSPVQSEQDQAPTSDSPAPTPATSQQPPRRRPALRTRLRSLSKSFRFRNQSKEDS